MTFVVYHRDQICFSMHYVLVMSTSSRSNIFFYALRLINEHRDILKQICSGFKIQNKDN